MTLERLISRTIMHLNDSNIKIPIIQKPWHNLFYELKKETFEEKPYYIEKLEFTWDAPHPISQTVNEKMNLIRSYLCDMNPYYLKIDKVLFLEIEKLKKDEPISESYLNHCFEKAKDTFIPYQEMTFLSY